MKVRHELLSEVGKVRKANEDSYGYDNTINGSVYVVCDGMGGHVGGAVASQLAVKSILEYFQRERYENLIQAIDRSFQFANEQVFAHTIADPSLKGMGTTAVVLIIQDDDCFIGHVGDSRIYLKTEGKLHRLTRDHSFVQALVDNGTITDEEAEHHPKKNQILKALGHSPEVTGTVCKEALKVQAGDMFLLCSDGLNGMINDKIIESEMEFPDLPGSARRLYQQAMDSRGADNITVVLVAVDESNRRGPSKFESFNPKQNRDTLYFTKEQIQSTEGFAADPKPKRKIFLVTLLLLVLIILAGLTYFFFIRDDGKQPDPAPKKKKHKIELTKSDLEGMTYDSILAIVNDTPRARVNFPDETVIACLDKKLIFYVEDEELTRVDTLGKTLIIQEEEKNNNEEVEKEKERVKKAKEEEKKKAAAATKDKFITVKVAQTISTLRGEISKIDTSCKNLAGEEELYNLNKGQFKGDKLKEFRETRIVPAGTKFIYKCK